MQTLASMTPRADRLVERLASIGAAEHWFPRSHVERVYLETLLHLHEGAGDEASSLAEDAAAMRHNLLTRERYDTLGATLRFAS